MTITTSYIFNHPIPQILTQYPQHFPAYLDLWEILLNTYFDPAEIRAEIDEEGEAEIAFEHLIQLLINTFDSLYISNPDTGEILFEIKTKTGEGEL